MSTRSSTATRRWRHERPAAVPRGGRSREISRRRWRRWRRTSRSTAPRSFKEYRGVETVSGLLRCVFETFEDFRYTDELAGSGDDPVHALIFRARVGERTLEGMDLLRIGPDGLIADFTVMVRPLSGLIALAQAMGPKVEAAGLKAG